ncbi:MULTISPECIES: DUF4389 domain-containing protein [unclassified Streptomyces]|uniref:DUF4389 domain-containing protein n=1 Tax=unclassified Streptomyces TaxID=2593676 RepID=UPI001660E599|nr:MULTISPECIES: DUF4389 domain-containing protein [unclassified Streptomyces]MBD0709654.1 hypothetical protein [Streptomyces sp. CBMA291]MBD0713961.1 hypothetical protein [Streptomyces sp. CBMA370]MBD0715222.1 hypothetical protein [Streptomyces sp. CBMA370]
MTTGWGPRPEGDAEGAEWRPVLDVPPPGRQRRWTVLLRWLLLVPQFLVVALLSFAAFFVTVAGWFAALFLGRLPDPIASFLGSVLAYQTRVTASAFLLVDRYPPFSFDAPDYPARIELRATPLNRVAVFFRLILIIPAAIIGSLAQSGWLALGWVFWLIGIVLGRLPEPVFGATAAVVRYRMRLSAYGSLLTPVYPKGILGDAPGPLAERPVSATRPLVLGTPAKVLVWLFLLLGIGVHVTSSTVSDDDWDDTYQTRRAAPLSR